MTLALVALSMIQKKYPNKLPEKLRTWEFLPSSLYEVLCLVNPEDEDTYVDVEKNVIIGGVDKQPVKVGSANNNNENNRESNENAYVSIKSFNMNPTEVNDINEARNEDFEQQTKF